MAKRTKTSKAVASGRKRSARDQARLLADAETALRTLLDRIPRRYAYGEDLALIFDPKQAR